MFKVGHFRTYPIFSPDQDKHQILRKNLKRFSSYWSTPELKNYVKKQKKVKDKVDHFQTCPRFSPEKINIKYQKLV